MGAAPSSYPRHSAEAVIGCIETTPARNAPSIIRDRAAVRPRLSVRLIREPAVNGKRLRLRDHHWHRYRQIGQSLL